MPYCWTETGQVAVPPAELSSDIGMIFTAFL